MKNILATYMLRRSLPRKKAQFISVPVKLEGRQRSIYDRITEESYIAEFDLTIANEAVRLIYQRQACVDATVFQERIDDNIFRPYIPSAKIEAVHDLLDTFPPDQKVVIFCSYRAPILRLEAELGKRAYTYLAGPKQKSDPATLLNRRNILISTYDSLGVGANLQAANICILLDLPLSQTLFRQALGRIDRIGQMQQPIYYIIQAKDTVDGDVRDMINDKLVTFDRLIVTDK